MEEAMQIVSVRDKRIKALVEDPSLTSVKGLDALETRKIAEMLTAIVVMTHPLQLLAVPSWKAHELTPGTPGKWSLTVTRNYRLTFYIDLDEQTVSVLDYEDYH
jgi:proteic killer suppression protein